MWPPLPLSVTYYFNESFGSKYKHISSFKKYFFSSNVILKIKLMIFCVDEYLSFVAFVSFSSVHNNLSLLFQQNFQVLFTVSSNSLCAYVYVCEHFSFTLYSALFKNTLSQFMQRNTSQVLSSYKVSSDFLNADLRSLSHTVSFLSWFDCKINLLFIKV